MDNSIDVTKTPLDLVESLLHLSLVGNICCERQDFGAESLQLLHAPDLPAHCIVFAMFIHPAVPLRPFRYNAAADQSQTSMSLFGEMRGEGETDSACAACNQVHAFFTNHG